MTGVGLVRSRLVDVQEFDGRSGRKGTAILIVSLKVHFSMRRAASCLTPCWATDSTMILNFDFGLRHNPSSLPEPISTMTRLNQLAMSG
jgi:hypothetical protein